MFLPFPRFTVFVLNPSRFISVCRTRNKPKEAAVEREIFLQTVSFSSDDVVGRLKLYITEGEKDVNASKTTHITINPRIG